MFLLDMEIAQEFYLELHKLLSPVPLQLSS